MKKKQVLVVDDDSQFVNLMKINAGTNEEIEATCVVAAESGPYLSPMREPTTLHQIWQGMDVIYLDYKMPGMNGDELLTMWIAEGLNCDEVFIIGISSDPSNWKEHELDDHKDPIDAPGHIRELS